MQLRDGLPANISVSAFFSPAAFLNPTHIPSSMPPRTYRASLLYRQVSHAVLESLEIGAKHSTIMQTKWSVRLEAPPQTPPFSLR